MGAGTSEEQKNRHKLSKFNPPSMAVFNLGLAQAIPCPNDHRRQSDISVATSLIFSDLSAN